MVLSCEATGCIFNGRWACLMPPEQLPSSRMCQLADLGVQLEIAPGEVLVSSQVGWLLLPADLHQVQLEKDCIRVCAAPAS